MKGSTEVVKGRIEEAAGVLAGNDKLRAKGQAHQAAGRVKLAVEEAVRKFKNGALWIVNNA